MYDVLTDKREFMKQRFLIVVQLLMSDIIIGNYPLDRQNDIKKVLLIKWERKDLFIVALKMEKILSQLNVM